MEHINLYESESDQLKRLISDLEDIGLDISFSVTYKGISIMTPLMKQEKRFLKEWIGPNKETIEEVSGLIPVPIPITKVMGVPRQEEPSYPDKDWNIQIKLEIKLRGFDDLCRIHFSYWPHSHDTWNNAYGIKIKIPDPTAPGGMKETNIYEGDRLIAIREKYLNRKPVTPDILTFLYEALKKIQSP